ncbi:reverse transcriptase domain-containing protein [Tanacetum coccineum]
MGKKGHYTNDCYQLKRQLEMAFESEKLNHLVKDVRQQGNNRGRQQGNNSTNGKIINMVRVRGKDLKRKYQRNQEEDWMNTPITFSPISADDVSDEPLIIEAEVEGYLVQRVFVDQGATVQVMFEHRFDNLPQSVTSQLTQTYTELVGFSEEQLIPMGKIELNVMFESEGLCQRTMIKFTVVRASSPYNIILGRTSLKELRAIYSITYAMMKFPTPRGVATLVVRTAAIFECRRLEEKQDVFAWQPSDMIGVPTRIIQHFLNVNLRITPVAQKRRVLGLEKSKAIMEEVEEWVKKGIVRPVRYPTWISNPVLVKKVDGTWRMCIDFKNVNSACPKDYYPLPEIDLKIKVVMGFPFKCFLDAYKGYHRIEMSEEDEEKMAFYTDQGTYCYTKMSFGLKNAWATYQRLVDSAFQAQLGQNLEAYVDDMVIKIKMEQEMIADIVETFDNLRKVNMKLNPKKCSLGVKEGKFLGYMVTLEGINANPKKTKAVADIMSLTILRNAKEHHKGEQERLLMDEGCKASIPRNEETDSSQSQGETTPIRYVSRTLHDAEKNYAPLEKLTLCLLHMSRRLRRYFEAHSIKVITDQPIKQILNKPEVFGKLARYAMELEAYNITYVPRNATKGQVLADFINEVPAGIKHLEICRTEYTYVIRLNFPSTNNEAEYEALLAGLRIAEKIKVQALKVKVDSKLVACQLNGEFVANSEGMTNKLASVSFNHLTKEALVEVLNRKSVDVQEVNTIVEEEEDNWITPVIKCLEEGVWPADENEMEAKPLAKTTDKEVRKFVWENIVYRFGLSRVIVTDNGTQLVNDPFKSWCKMWKIKQVNTAVAYPQANGLVERANKSLMHGLKARLGCERVGWLDLREMPTYQTIQYNEAQNKEDMRLNLDLIQERRETAAIREAKYKKKVEQYYNKRVCPLSFRVGDFVYRRNESSRVKS